MSELVLFDVGPRRVAGALVSLPESGEAPRLRHEVGREIHPATSSVPLIVRALEQAAAELRAATPRRPRDLIIILAPEFYSARVARFEHRPEKQFVFTDRLLEELTERALVDLRAEGRREVLESSVLELKLNGYPVSEWRRVPASEAAFWHYGSSVDLAILRLFRRALQAAWPDFWPRFHSSVLTDYRAQEALEDLHPQTLLIKWRPEALELSQLESGRLARLVTLPTGEDWLAGRLVAAAGQSRTAARSWLRLYEASELSEREARRGMDWLASLGVEWTGAIERWFNQSRLLGEFPASVYVVGREPFTSLGARWLTTRWPDAKTQQRSPQRDVLGDWLLPVTFYDKIITNVPRR